MNPKRWLFLGLALLTTLRLWLVGHIELSPDEAYYYLWSQHPDICYYSKGPGISAAIWISTHIFGGTEFGIRVFSPLLALATSLLLFFFTRRLYGQSVAVWGTLALNFFPILHVGGVLMTIDPLSIFFWMAAIYTLWLALEHQSNDAADSDPGWSFWWPATGALIGLGFLCKWTNAMQLLSVIILLASSPKMRTHFRKPGFWSMLLVFAIFALPPILWNARHNWITFSHVTHRGGLHQPFKLSLGEPFVFLGLHLGVYSPILGGALLVALFNNLRKWRTHFKPRFLLSFTLPLFVMYGWLSLKKAGEANWTAPAIISLGVLAAAYWHERAIHSPRVRRTFGIGFGLALLLSVTIIDVDLLRKAGIPFPRKADPSARLRGWQTAAEHIGVLRNKLEKESGRPIFLIASSYGAAASLSFYLPEKPLEGEGHPPVYIPESQNIENQFSFWPRYDEFVALKPGQKPRDSLFTEEAGINPFHGRTALFVTDNEDEKPPSAITGGFGSTELIACLDIERRGQRLRQLRIFRCDNYRSLSL
jgi:4-amino-4-deoxy-L-arabinose transferase-like glycosyltransferase